jgi:hypothetical protein
MGFFKDVGVHLQSYFNDQVCMEQLTPEGAAYARMAGGKQCWLRTWLRSWHDRSHKDTGHNQ